MMDFKTFEEFTRTSFPQLGQKQVEQFRLMEEGYKEWNSKINIISRKDIGSLYDHHVLHSLSIAEYLKVRRPELFSAFSSGGSGARVLDLGTGGGFPGIPLAVMFPEVEFVLCDSIGKKTLVAKEMASRLGLANVEVVNARAETLPGSFDHVVSRAVASLTDFYPWVRGKFTGSVLYLKGGDVAEEIAGLMAKERLRRGSVGTWPVDAWLRDEYFSGKFVIEILATN